MWPFKKKEIYFKVGDIVKCIDDREWNGASHTMDIAYGKTYKILMVVTCPTCGQVSYDIGSRFKNKKSHTTCTPSEHEVPAQGIHVAGHFRFAKADEASMESREEIEAELEKSLKKEDYEKAAKLRDKLEKITCI